MIITMFLILTSSFFVFSQFFPQYETSRSGSVEIAVTQGDICVHLVGCAPVHNRFQMFSKRVLSKRAPLRLPLDPRDIETVPTAVWSLWAVGPVGVLRDSVQPV